MRAYTEQNYILKLAGAKNFDSDIVLTDEKFIGIFSSEL